MGCDFYVFKPVVGVDDHNFGGNRIAGRKLADRRWRLHFVGHRHGVHETGNFVAVDDGGLVLSVDGNYAAGEGVTFRGGRLCAMAGREGNADDDKKCERMKTDAARMAAVHVAPLIDLVFSSSVTRLSLREALIKCLRKVWTTEGTGVHGGNPELIRGFLEGCGGPPGGQKLSSCARPTAEGGRRHMGICWAATFVKCSGRLESAGGGARATHSSHTFCDEAWRWDATLRY